MGNPPEYFKHFFDLRKEFRKSFHHSNASLLQIIEFFKIRKGFLFSSMEYCDIIVEILKVMLDQGHFFRKPETSVFAEDSPVVKIRGLPWQATENDIVEFFEPLAIETIEIIFSGHGSSTGEAFVIFDTPYTAKKSLDEFDKKKIGPRYIELFPTSYNEMNHALQIMAKNMNQPSVLRMRGLPFSITIEELVHFFDGLALIDGGIYIDIDLSGKPTGTAYVQFQSLMMLNEALKRNKEKIRNRYIELFRSSQDELLAKLKQFEAPMVSPWIVRISNFPKEYHEVDIANFFSGLNIAPHGIHLIFTEANESTGEGFIEFLTEKDVLLAQKHHRDVIGELQVDVFKSSPEEMLH